MKLVLALLLLVLTACVSPRSVPKTPEASEGYLTGADSVHLFYRSFGHGSDTVVVVHGFQGFGMSYMLPDLLPLARNRVLIFFDQRGDGSSSAVEDTAQLGLQARVRDLEALRRHFGLGRLTLLGHSGGAAVALQYAVEHPNRVERLVLVAPPPPVRHPFGEQTMRTFLPRLDSATWARMNTLQTSLATAEDPVRVCQEITGTMLRHAYFADPARVEHMQGDFCASVPERLRTQPVRSAHFQQSLPADWRPHVRTVSTPTLLLHGDHDAIPVAASRAWAEALPDAGLIVITGADHLPWIEQPRQFFSAVDQFLRPGRTAPMQEAGNDVAVARPLWSR